VFINRGLIIDLQNNFRAIFISGRSLCWVGSEIVLFERNNNIYKQEIASTKNEIILRNASYPVFLNKEISIKGVSLSDLFDELEKVIISNTVIETYKLTYLNKKQLWLLRNTIFARHGRVFDNIELKKWFETKKWYAVNSNYSDNLLTNNDKSNISAILAVESKIKD
jgi:hypothetical protein